MDLSGTDNLNGLLFYATAPPDTLAVLESRANASPSNIPQREMAKNGFGSFASLSRLCSFP